MYRRKIRDMRSCLMEMVGLLASSFPGDIIKVTEDMVIHALIIIE